MIFVDSAGPSDADWWIVWLTGFSVVVSGVLAWLAYRNGRKATDIARDASERDEEHRRREVDQREHEERAQVALAMMRAVSAAEAYQAHRVPGQTDIHWQETVADIEKEMVRARSEALAHVELYATADEDDELRPWIDSALHAIVNPRPVGDEPFRAMDYLYFVRRAIRLWNLREVTSGQIIAGKLPPEVGPGKDDDAPESSE